MSSLVRGCISGSSSFSYLPTILLSPSWLLPCNTSSFAIASSAVAHALRSTCKIVDSCITSESHFASCAKSLANFTQGWILSWRVASAWFRALVKFCISLLILCTPGITSSIHRVMSVVVSILERVVTTFSFIHSKAPRKTLMLVTPSLVSFINLPILDHIPRAPPVALRIASCNLLTRFFLASPIFFAAST